MVVSEANSADCFVGAVFWISTETGLQLPEGYRYLL